MLEELYNGMDGHTEEAERLWEHYDREPFAHDLAEAAEDQDNTAGEYESLIRLVSELIEPGMWRLYDYENSWYLHNREQQGVPDA